MSSKKRYDKNRRLLTVGECQLKNGRYVYRWTDAFGLRHAVYAKDLDMLRIRKQKIQLNKLEGIREPPAGLTVERLFEIWKGLKRGIKESTYSGYVYTFDSLIRPYIGKKLVVHLKRTTILAYYLKLLDERKLSIGTVENVHTILHQILQYAVDDDYLRKNPSDNLIKELKASYHYKSGKRESLSLKHEVAFLKYLMDYSRYQHWYPTFFIMANTGMRVGELTGLRWCDVDFENGLIDINHTLVYFNYKDNDTGTACHYAINTPKTENGVRKIVMTQAVKDAFKMQRDYLELLDIKSIDNIDGYNDFIFLNSKGHVCNQNILNANIHRVVNEYNSMCTNEDEKLPHFSCHVLRHTYATRLIESGANIKFVQYQMGHSEIQTTMDIYVDVTDEFKRVQIRPFEEYMDSVLGETSSEITDLSDYIS